MFICSTVLYFGELPVGYSLLKTDENYRLHPATVPEGGVTPPTIFITRQNCEWKINGVESRGLLQQIQKLIKTDGLIQLPEMLSAAS